MKAKTTKQKRQKDRMSTVVRLGVMTELITCPACGAEIPIWSEGEEQTRCLYCGHRFFRRESTVH